MPTHPTPAPGKAQQTAQHTPGPWQSDRMHFGSSKDRRTGFVVNGPDAEPLPVRICDIRCSPESPFAVAEANARLIAAAPELLAHCKAMLAQFDKLAESGGLTAALDLGLDPFEAMKSRSAIARATGGKA